jgi:hypothetical protein
MSPLPASERTTRSLLAFSATAALLGIAFSASGGQDLGSVISVAGVLLMVYALHRFGRSGPDEPI